MQELTESWADTIVIPGRACGAIERDLHDGAEARLVSLGMSLGLAEDVLLRRSREGRRPAGRSPGVEQRGPAELRDLVRGIDSPVLGPTGARSARSRPCAGLGAAGGHPG